MDAAALNAITDLATLRAMVREQRGVIARHEATIDERDKAVAQHMASIAARDRTIRTRDLKIDKLAFEPARLRRMQFGAKSESLDSVQHGLFEETKAEDIAAIEAELEALQEEIGTPAAKAPHKKPVRRPLPEDLRRETTVHTPDQYDCAACSAALVKIGEHASEKLDVVPPTFFVRRDVYPQYACPHCQTIVAEPVAPAIIDRGQATLDPGALERDFPAQFTRQRSLHGNHQRGAAEAFDEERFGAIVLTRRSVPVTARDGLPAMLAAIRAGGLDLLPWGDPARRLRARVLALRTWMPELGLPDLSDTPLLAALDTWLGPWLAGKHRLDAVRADDLAQALTVLLNHQQRQRLDAHAPEHLVVPSGQSRRLEYAGAAAPVLAVKLQELFGLADTPRVADGRVAVTLHLLSPAGRPIQITQDLRGFWERTYPEVRKELKGRYPRHPWPDDPWRHGDASGQAAGCLGTWAAEIVRAAKSPAWFTIRRFLAHKTTMGR